MRFELTRIAPTQLECAALDRSAICALDIISTKEENEILNFVNKKTEKKNKISINQTFD